MADFPILDLLGPTAQGGSASPKGVLTEEFLTKLMAENEAARLAKGVPSAEQLAAANRFGSAPAASPAPAPALATADAPAGRLASVASKARGFGAGVGRVAGVGGGLVAAGLGAADMAENGVGLGNSLAVGTGLASLSPVTALPAAGLGAGVVAGKIATPDGFAVKEATAASQLLSKIPGLNALFPAQFANTDGTVATPESVPTTLSAPFLAKILEARKTGVAIPPVDNGFGAGGISLQGSIPSSITPPAPPTAEPAAPPPRMPVLSRNQQGDPGTGVIRNNDTGTVTEIAPRAGFGAGRSTIGPEEKKLLKYGPLVAAFGNPDTLDEAAMAKRARSATIADAHALTARASATKAAVDRGTSRTVEKVPDEKNPLKTNLVLVDKLGETAKQLEPTKTARVVTDAELDTAASKFVTPGAPITQAARQQAIQELQARGFDVSNFKAK